MAIPDPHDAVTSPLGAGETSQPLASSQTPRPAAADAGAAQGAVPVASGLQQAGHGEVDEEQPPRQLHPLPRGLVELYGLLAVLFVLVPEWMASGALFGFRDGRMGSDLPAPSGAWTRLPELRLASLNLAALRQLAGAQGVIGYSHQNRQELTTRLLRRLKAKPLSQRLM